MNSPSLDIAFGGRTLTLDATGALYWQAQAMLVVSDMHLEKATFLAKHGSLIPPYDTQDTLERLEQLIERYRPRELILLGDSFHDRHAWERLAPSIRGRIMQLAERVEHCRWIVGNHDVGLQNHALPNVETERIVDAIRLGHEHSPDAALQIIGHYHPKVTLALRGRGLRARCFVHTENLLIMPAFGSYTGGLNISDPAFKDIIQGRPRTIYILHQARIGKLPAA